MIEKLSATAHNNSGTHEGCATSKPTVNITKKANYDKTRRTMGGNEANDTEDCA